MDDVFFRMSKLEDSVVLGVKEDVEDPPKETPLRRGMVQGNWRLWEERGEPPSESSQNGEEECMSRWRYVVPPPGE
jgi:hypothetical protein